MTHWEQWVAVFFIVFAVSAVGLSIEAKLSSIREALGRIMDKLDKR